MHAIVHAADIQDRDGGVLVMATLFGLYPFLLKLYADGGYQGPASRSALQNICSSSNVEIVKRSDQAKGFVVAAQRWIVERTFAWLEPLPKTGQGLGMPQPQGARFPQARLHPPHATKAMQSTIMFPDRLLRILRASASTNCRAACSSASRLRGRCCSIRTFC